MGTYFEAGSGIRPRSDVCYYLVEITGWARVHLILNLTMQKYNPVRPEFSSNRRGERLSDGRQGNSPDVRFQLRLKLEVQEYAP